MQLLLEVLYTVLQMPFVSLCVTFFEAFFMIRALMIRFYKVSFMLYKVLSAAYKVQYLKIVKENRGLQCTILFLFPTQTTQEL